MELSDFEIRQTHLWVCLSGIKDKRRVYSVRYSVATTLSIALMGLMSGYEGYTAWADFAQRNKETLKKMFHLRSVPAPSTFMNIFNAIDSADLFNALNKWPSGLAPAGGHLALDGKAVKASVREANTAFQNFISIVSVFHTESEQVVGMEAFHSKKTGEIEIARALIERLESGHLLTLDALHAQKNGGDDSGDGE